MVRSWRGRSIQLGADLRFDALVTDGHTRAGLAVARSLARQNVSVLVLGNDASSPAFHSRYVKHALPAPSAMQQPQAFMEFVLEVVERHKIRLAIPVTDQALVLFDQHRKSLGALCKIAMASEGALRQVLDKRLNLELASRLGVPCARQFELEDRRQIPDMIATLGFPIVLKRPGDPIDPNVPKFDFRVLYAHNERELNSYLDQHCQDGRFPLLQECATGEIHNLCCFAADGDLLAAHEYQSIRRLEGAGVYRKIIQPSPDLMEHAQALLRALRWDGVAHVGFFVNRPLNRVWYMEINGRFWASVQGSIHAGWDFPYWTYDYFLNGNRPDPKPIEVGSLTCWHLGDLIALLNYWRGGEVPATGTHPSPLRSTLQYLSGFRPNVHCDVFSWADPLPAFWEYWQVRKRLLGMIQRRISTAPVPQIAASAAPSHGNR